jgi:hypothetical protein
VVARDWKVEKITRTLRPEGRRPKGRSTVEIEGGLAHMALLKRGSLLLTAEELSDALRNANFPPHRADSIAREYASIGREPSRGQLHARCFLEEYVRKEWLDVLGRLKKLYESSGEAINVHVRVSLAHLLSLLSHSLGAAKAQAEGEGMRAAYGLQPGDRQQLTWEEVVVWYCHQEQCAADRFQRFFKGREPIQDAKEVFVLPPDVS